MNNELTHHGIKLQRWGIRRYQNLDGTLTEEGKRRYAKEVSANRLKSKKNRADEDDLKDPKRWVRDDISRRKSVLDNERQLTKDLQNLERATRSTKKRPRLKLDEISDKELRDTINRELLERQYNDLFNSNNVSRGRERVTRALEVAGGILGVASTSLGIALAIKELKD